MMTSTKSTRKKKKTMTDSDQAARLAAIRARRGQAPAETPVVAAPAAAQAPAAAPARVAAAPSRTQQRVAAGARILATGLTASGVFGITTAIAAANQPKQVVYTQAPVETTPVVDPAALTGTTLAPVVTVPGSVVENVVLTIPPVGGAAAPAAAAPAANAAAAPAAGGGQAAAPSPTAAPAPAPAPTPAPTTAAPVTAPPPPPCTTNASGKCK